MVLRFHLFALNSNIKAVLSVFPTSKNSVTRCLKHQIHSAWTKTKEIIFQNHSYVYKLGLYFDTIYMEFFLKGCHNPKKVKFIYY